MKTKELLDVLKFVGKVIGSGNVLPVLDNFLFIDGTIVATNLETTIIAKTNIKGTFLVDKKFIIGVLQKTSAKEIDVINTQDGHTVIIKALDGTQEFRSSGLATFDNFPKTPNCTVRAGNLTANDMNMIYKARQLASKDELRPVLTGVYLGHELKEYSSTDAHVLTWKALEGEFKKDYIIPGRVADLLKDFGECNLSDDENGTYIQLENEGGLKIITRHIDGKFPNYRAVIPQKPTTIFRCDRKELLKIVEESLICANTTTYHMILEINKGADHIVVRSENVDFELSFKGTLTGSLKMKDSKLVIGFHAGYFKKCLGYLDNDSLKLQFGATNRAVVINDEV